MWPSFRQTLLSTIQIIQDYYQSHAQLVRNVGIASMLAGTIAGAVICLSAAALAGSINPLYADFDSIITSLYSGLMPATLISILAGSLIGIHIYKGSLPTNGLEFVSGIPKKAWRLFMLGSITILILFSIHQFLEEIQRERNTYENFTQLNLKLFTWIENGINVLAEAVTPYFAIRIYLSGIGQRNDIELRPRFFATAIVLFFWIQTIQTISILINQLVTTPISMVVPSYTIMYTIMGAVSVFVFLFGLIPATAIASSIIAPENEIQFEGETETTSL